jgi:hypothetical protein
MAGLRRMPAEIAVLAGDFGSFPAAQPIVFAHVLDISSDLDLDHVEVIPARGARSRLAAHFDAETIARLEAAVDPSEAIVLILPAAHESLGPPEMPSRMLRPIGIFRGYVRRLVQSGPPP